MLTFRDLVYFLLH